MPSFASQQIRATFEKLTQLSTVPITLQRQEWETSALANPLPDHTTIEPLTIADIPCERVSCGNVENDKLLIHLHGGGFISGSCKTHRKLAAYLSRESKCPVLLIDYRLAPEHPFPNGLNDVVNVYRQLLESDYTASQLLLSGDSAGGGLVVSTLLILRDAGVPMPIASVLLSPWLDLAVEGKSIISRAELDPFITDFDLHDSAQKYAPKEKLRLPLVSPIYADLSGLPPFLIHVGDHEILLSDAQRFAEAGKRANVDITLDVWDDMWHVWHHSVPELPEALQAIEKIGIYIAKRLS